MLLEPRSKPSGIRARRALPEESGREHSSFWVAHGRVPVELHWSLVGAEGEKVWGVFSNETETVPLADGSVENDDGRPCRCAASGVAMRRTMRSMKVGSANVAAADAK